MPSFFEYLRNITYYLIFASVVGIFAPAGKYKKFVSLVLGFVLLVLMLQPLAGLGREIPITEWFTGVILGETAQVDAETSFTQWRDSYLSEAFEAQLEAQLRQLLINDGFTVHSAEFTYSNDFSQITSVHVNVSRTETPQRVPFIRIQPVRVGQSTSEPECPTTSAAKTLISQFYNLPEANIYVSVTSN